MIHVTGIDPLSRKFTLASLAMETYRSLFLKENEIGITPIEGYLACNNSKIGRIWLDWIESKGKIQLVREKYITTSKGHFHVDGYHQESNTVYEFYGCYFHGCPLCFPELTKSYKRTKDRERLLQLRGFNVKSTWECQFKANEFIDGRKIVYDRVEFAKQ